MKKIILVITLLMFAMTTMAQEGTQLGVKGLHQPKKVAKFAVLSVSMQNNSCTITKHLDRHSEKIEQATQTGRVLPKAFIKFDGVDGEIIKEMTTVYLSNYSISSQGNNATETFTIYFNSIVEQN